MTTELLGRRAAGLSRCRAQLRERHGVKVGVGHSVPPSNICSNNLGHRSDIVQASAKPYRVHRRVHQRGADSSTPLVVTVPPEGFEPPTFGTGNQTLLQLEYDETGKSRGITRMSEVYRRVYPGTQWVHLRVHAEGA